ncbi:hypothetical protein, conserved [Eimeria tenella]|uniref:Uncharacterized protein n=1 Tax=Eimeria tenella TaxID=5802 RepID=U6KTU8_EIMTE|nr:hypothetical protein, conserved [Eimeria tenella]CDJ41391.1 hypothetical protein, conserved [Eimeria tenella]|eukprot:XP_013232141.1 hypothetical protein, conserved [Eimeria tenella]
MELLRLLLFLFAAAAAAAAAEEGRDSSGSRPEPLASGASALSDSSSCSSCSSSSSRSRIPCKAAPEDPLHGDLPRRSVGYYLLRRRAKRSEREKGNMPSWKLVDLERLVARLKGAADSSGASPQPARGD